MKKHISLIGGLLISTILIGCSETKVLDESTKDNISEKYTITERNIENTDKEHLFTPLFYDVDTVYGTMSPNKEADSDKFAIPYYIDIEGNIKKVENDKFTDNEIDFIKGNNGFRKQGIYMIDSNKLNDRKYYYMDVIDKTKFELKDFEINQNKIENKLKSIAIGGSKINDNYYIYQYISMDDGNISDTRDFIIIDLKNEKYYVNNNEKKIKKFYYDDNLNSIIAIDEIGKMYKLKFDENSIIFEEYKTIDIEKVNSYNRETFLVSKLSNNKLLIRVQSTESKEYMDYFNAVYDIETKEVIYFDKEKTILDSLENTKFYCIYYKDEKYLGEVSEDGNINLIYKLDNDDGYKYFYSEANEEGNKVFLTRIKISEESIKNPEKPLIKEDIKYSILEIQER